MPEYLHPGVYVEETSFRAKPIEGVSTSTAGLVGRTRKGVEGRPTLVTSFTEFVREFGAPFPTPTELGDYLGHAVRAFFENGGRRAYVVRALAADAEAASTLEAPAGPTRVGIGAVLRLPATATVIGPTDQLPLDSLRGIGVGSQIEIWARSTPTSIPVAPISDHTVTAYNAIRNSVTVDPPIPLGRVLAPSGVYVLIRTVAPEPGHVDGPIVRARSRGESGNDLAIELRPRDLPPTRLATRRYQRNRPVLATFAGTGPGPGAASMTIDATAARQLRVGDTISFNGVPRAVTSIAPATLPLGGIGGGASYAAGSRPTVSVVRRTPAAADATPPVPVYRLAAAEAMDLSGASPFTVPHGVAASLHPGDRISVSAGGPPTTATVGALAFTGTVLVGFAPGPEDFSTSVVRLEATVSSGLTTRLVVADVAGLADPYRATAEPIAVSAGTAVDASTVLLVDRVTRQVYVRNVPGPGSFPDGATNETWTSFEALQVSDGTDTIRVASTGGFYTGAIVEVDSGSAKTPAIVTSVDAPNRTLTLSGPIPAFDAAVIPADRRAFVRVLELDALIYERDPGGPLVLKETFANLTWNDNPDQASFARYYLDRINDPEFGSRLVTIEVTPGGVVLPTTQPTTDEGFPAFLLGGTNGSALTAVDLIGTDDGPNHRFGIQALSERRDIALVAVPGVTDEIVQQALITHCELLKYRFAVLDGRPGQSVVTDLLAHRNNYDTKYAGYYAPWLGTVELATGRTLLVPPSGHVLGICARVDNERGVHKAPANETVRGILDVELPFTDGEQDVLNPLGVNLIREFEGRGIRVWGARTLSSDPEWKYVNVRRLFIFLEHSIDNGTQWVVFEPNNEALWARVKATIESFLFGVWKTGALMGTKPEDAFFVRCDRTTMTQDDIDNGRLVCLIGVAPTFPAEFVIFRIGQFTASSNLA